MEMIGYHDSVLIFFGGYIFCIRLLRKQIDYIIQLQFSCILFGESWENYTHTLVNTLWFPELTMSARYRFLWVKLTLLHGNFRIFCAQFIVRIVLMHFCFLPDREAEKSTFGKQNVSK